MNWIKCSDELPDSYRDVLVFVDKVKRVGWFDQAIEEWEIYSTISIKPTHWQELPEAPKDE